MSFFQSWTRNNEGTRIRLSKFGVTHSADEIAGWDDTQTQWADDWTYAQANNLPDYPKPPFLSGAS